MIYRNFINGIAAALLLAAANLALAQDAGTVSFATGDVVAERQPAVALAKGDTVVVSDTIVTGSASRAQLLLIDGARVAIRPGSRLVIEEYIYAAADAAPGATVSSSDDKSVMNLVKGGFRSITGAIGKENPQNYEVRTAVGVLGIRGTNFAVLLCGGDCDTAPGVSPGTTVPDGLYIMVTEGIVVFSNELTDIEIHAGEFVFIPLDTRRPERLDTVPPVFIDDSDFRFEPEPGTGKRPDDNAAPTGFDSRLGTRRVPEGRAPDPGTADPKSGKDGSSGETPRQPIQGTDPAGNPVDLTPGGAPDPSNRSISWSSGPLGQADAIFSGAQDNLPGQYQLDANDNVTGFENLYPGGRTGPEPATFDIGSSASVDTGSDAMTVMRWGRWAGGTATITLGDGTDVSQDLGNQSLHWISSPEWATPPVMPITGTASYSLVGSTAPTDSLGNVGVLGNAPFQADFTAMLVNSSLVIDIAGFNWTAAGTGNIGAAAMLPAHLFQGLYGTVTITDPTGGSLTGNGMFSGFFSQPGPGSDPTFPGGAGLTYSLQDSGGGVSVSGAAAFGNP